MAQVKYLSAIGACVWAFWEASLWQIETKKFDNKLKNGHKKQQQEQKQRKLLAISALSTARLKKNFDSLVLITNKSERDLDFVVFTFEK